MELLVKRLRPKVELPRKAKEDDAAFDLYADLGGIDSYIIEPGEVKRFDTGIGIKLPAGHCALFIDRSGNANNGIHLLGGLVDEGYVGELKVVLVNLSKQRQKVLRNDRIAQFLVIPVPGVTIKEVSELPETERGASGFGSTGR